MTYGAVLTGDLVKSTQARHLKNYQKALQNQLDRVAGRYRCLEAPSVFRGDAFQVCVPLSHALEAAILIRAGLIATTERNDIRRDAKISVGVGRLAGAEECYEEVYVLSGRGLDGMKKGRLRIHSSCAMLDLSLGLSTAFVDEVISSWTRTEAETYTACLLGHRRHVDIAASLGKGRPTVTKALLRARAALVDRYLRDGARLIEELIETPAQAVASPDSRALSRRRERYGASIRSAPVARWRRAAPSRAR